MLKTLFTRVFSILSRKSDQRAGFPKSPGQRASFPESLIKGPGFPKSPGQRASFPESLIKGPGFPKSPGQRASFPESSDQRAGLSRKADQRAARLSQSPADVEQREGRILRRGKFSRSALDLSLAEEPGALAATRSVANHYGEKLKPLSL